MLLVLNLKRFRVVTLFISILSYRVFTQNMSNWNVLVQHKVTYKIYNKTTRNRNVNFQKYSLQ